MGLFEKWLGPNKKEVAASEKKLENRLGNDAAAQLLELRKKTDSISDEEIEELLQKIEAEKSITIQEIDLIKDEVETLQNAKVLARAGGKPFKAIHDSLNNLLEIRKELLKQREAEKTQSDETAFVDAAIRLLDIKPDSELFQENNKSKFKTLLKKYSFKFTPLQFEYLQSRTGIYSNLKLDKIADNNVEIFWKRIQELKGIQAEAPTLKDEFENSTGISVSEQGIECNGEDLLAGANEWTEGLIGEKMSYVTSFTKKDNKSVLVIDFPSPNLGKITNGQENRIEISALDDLGYIQITRYGRAGSTYSKPTTLDNLRLDVKVYLNGIVADVMGGDSEFVKKLKGVKEYNSENAVLKLDGGEINFKDVPGNYVYNSQALTAGTEDGHLRFSYNQVPEKNAYKYAAVFEIYFNKQGELISATSSPRNDDEDYDTSVSYRKICAKPVVDNLPAFFEQFKKDLINPTTDNLPQPAAAPIAPEVKSPQPRVENEPKTSKEILQSLEGIKDYDEVFNRLTLESDPDHTINFGDIPDGFELETPLKTGKNFISFDYSQKDENTNIDVSMIIHFAGKKVTQVELLYKIDGALSDRLSQVSKTGQPLTEIPSLLSGLRAEMEVWQKAKKTSDVAIVPAEEINEEHHEEPELESSVKLNVLNKEKGTFEYLGKTVEVIIPSFKIDTISVAPNHDLIITFVSEKPNDRHEIVQAEIKGDASGFAKYIALYKIEDAHADDIEKDLIESSFNRAIKTVRNFQDTWDTLMSHVDYRNIYPRVAHGHGEDHGHKSDHAVSHAKPDAHKPADKGHAKPAEKHQEKHAAPAAKTVASHAAPKHDAGHGGGHAHGQSHGHADGHAHGHHEEKAPDARALPKPEWKDVEGGEPKPIVNIDSGVFLEMLINEADTNPAGDLSKKLAGVSEMIFKNKTDAELAFIELFKDVVESADEKSTMGKFSQALKENNLTVDQFKEMWVGGEQKRGLWKEVFPIFQQAANDDRKTTIEEATDGFFNSMNWRKTWGLAKKRSLRLGIFVAGGAAGQVAGEYLEDEFKMNDDTSVVMATSAAQLSNRWLTSWRDRTVKFIDNVGEEDIKKGDSDKKKKIGNQVLEEIKAKNEYKMRSMAAWLSEGIRQATLQRSAKERKGGLDPRDSAGLYLLRIEAAHTIGEQYHEQGDIAGERLALLDKYLHKLNHSRDAASAMKKDIDKNYSDADKAHSSRDGKFSGRADPKGNLGIAIDKIKGKYMWARSKSKELRRKGDMVSGAMGIGLGIALTTSSILSRRIILGVSGMLAGGEIGAHLDAETVKDFLKKETKKTVKGVKEIINDMAAIDKLDDEEKKEKLKNTDLQEYINTLDVALFTGQFNGKAGLKLEVENLLYKLRKIEYFKEDEKGKRKFILDSLIKERTGTQDKVNSEMKRLGETPMKWKKYVGGIIGLLGGVVGGKFGGKKWID
ncbi:MAG: hypothetical protein KAZ30_00235 [Candidatus Magasanikbacteria bacterium]|nr:hypothetical protein [Candidatus Magasanikbacteria bacterium]